MEGLKKVRPKRALVLAKAYRPTIYQEWRGMFDCLTPLFLSDMDNIAKVYGELIKKPSIYYLVNEDEEYYYIFYMIPHLVDWSSSSLEVVRRLDSHMFDTESICFRILKSDTSKVDIATICHYRILFASHSHLRIFIEAEGHGIHPYDDKKIDKSKKYMVYQPSGYQLENLGKFSEAQWELIKKALGGKAKIPHEQYDSNLIKSTAHEKGDMFLRPNILFTIAKEKGLLK